MNNPNDNTADSTHNLLYHSSRLFDGINDLSTSPNWLQNIGLVCVCVYVYAWYLFDFVDHFSHFLLLIGFYLYFKKDRDFPIWKDPIILLLTAAVLVQLISWFLAIQSHPDWANGSPKAHRMGIWFKMIPIAIILGGRTDRVILCWLLALMALLSASLINGGGIEEWLAGLRGKRVDFGINNAQHAAMLNGVLFISTIAALTINLKLNLLHRYMIYILLALLVSISAIVVIITQTRAIWLALAVTMPFFLLSVCLVKKQNPRKIVRNIIVAALLISVFFIFFQETIQKRIGDSTFQALGSTTSIKQKLIKDNSFNMRFITWQESLNWIKQKPFFGWGSAAVERKIVSAALELPESSLPFGHLHNSFLATLANYGIAGLVVLILLCLYLSYCAYKSWKAKIMPTPIYLFLTGFLPFWVIVNNFESYFYYSSGEYTLAIVGGVILTYYWKHIKENGKAI